MRRGEIWEVDLEPTRGSEASKRRPAVIISNNAANAVVERLRRGTITVVPLTSNISNVRRFQALLPAGRTKLKVDSKAKTEQIRALAHERFKQRLGSVPQDLMAEIEDALRIQLDL